MKYPNMREELLQYLDVLERGDSKNLDYAVHFLFDDTVLADAPERAVGAFLYNSTESDALRRVVGALERVLKKYGTTMPNADYVRTPEWGDVAAESRAARELLSRSV